MKKGQDLTRVSDQNLQTILNSVKAGVSIATDTSCRVIRHNPAAAEFFRIGSWESLSFSSNIYPDFKVLYQGIELPAKEMPIQRTVGYGEEIKDQELEMVWEDGVRKTALWSASPLIGDNGEIIGAIATFKDITERKLMEEELNHSHQRLEELVQERTKELAATQQQVFDILESISDCFFTLDKELHFTFVNGSAERIFGLPREAAIGRSIKDVLLGVNPITIEKCRRVIEEGTPQNYEVFSVPIQKWVDVSVYPAKEGISIYFRDITERKQLEKELQDYQTELELKVKERTKALREREERYRLLFENSLDGILETRPNGTILDANPAACRLFGRIKEEICAVGWKGIVDLSDPRVEAAIREREQTGRLHCELTHIRNDGTKFETEVTSSIYKTEDDKEYASMIIRDRSKRKKMEEALRQSEERFSKAFQLSPTVMSIARLDDNRNIDVNDAWVKYFRISREESIGKTPGELGFWSDSVICKGFLKMIKQVGRVENLEMQFGTKDGRTITALVSAETIFLDGTSCLLSSMTDITERKRQEEERIGLEVKAATRDSQNRLLRLKKMAAEAIGIGELKFSSESMRSIILEAQQYHQDRSMPVLIQGETGTGKEVIAKLIHFGDLNELEAPFVDVNCAAISPGLFESELFGYEAGSFTGGLTKGQKGKFDLAAGGTLFLDEISELTIEQQSKLLRVIQEREFYRVGGLKKIITDVRIICATNGDLEQKVEAGSFRRDLFYRLKVGFIKIPPLRERREEILTLANLFLVENSRRRGKRFECLGPEAARVLLEYHWPGNVRELKNAIEWAVFMYDDKQLKPHHLRMVDENTLEKSEGKALSTLAELFLALLPEEGTSIDDYAAFFIYQLLKMKQGNKAETARYLGVSRQVLYRYLKRLKRFGIDCAKKASM